ncbi:hypothetical protein ACIU0H_28715 [Pseudomonas aeruginosa]
MTTSLLPQELYLLERYSSLEYYSQMRDAWEVMLKHVEDCMDRFMLQLPVDYRARPLPRQRNTVWEQVALPNFRNTTMQTLVAESAFKHLEDSLDRFMQQPMQPDTVRGQWGKMVIPSFRSTMRDLDTGVIELTHGDLGGLLKGIASTDFRELTEFSCDWMDEVEPGAADKYCNLMGHALILAFNIYTTIGAYWNKGALAECYSPDARGPLNAPSAWPRYRLNPDVRVRTGEPVLHAGIYLPDLDDSNAQFLLASHHYQYADTCPPARVGYDPQTQDVSEVPARWTLVERVPD